MKTLDSAWRKDAAKFMNVSHLSQERSLHPAMLELINSCAGSRLLDYGCGDGRIIEALDPRWEVDAYDPSPQMQEIANARVGQRVNRLSGSVGDLSGPYDVIVLGMVIMCIPYAEQVDDVLRRCAALIAPGGKLILSTTHPCFRNSVFSNVRTSFCDEQEFSYMRNGIGFDVEIRDSETEVVVFQDFHWSLGFTFELLKRSGLFVSTLVEISDDPASNKRNPNVPLYLILECEKSP